MLFRNQGNIAYVATVLSVSACAYLPVPTLGQETSLTQSQPHRVAGPVDTGEIDGALFEDVHVVKLPRQDYGYRSMPGDIELLEDDRLLLAYTHMLGNGQPDGAIAARSSSDDGMSWSEEFILVPRPTPTARDRYAHPGFLRLANGQILLSYIYTAGANPRYGHNYYRRSWDEAKTWGDQLILTPQPGYNLVHNDKLIQLEGGRLIAPVAYELQAEGGDHAGYVSYTMYSDDNGYSWRRSRNVVNALPIEAQEPHVVELKDGRLMMLMRTYSGFVLRAHSSDRGETWSKGAPVRDLVLPPYSTSALNVKRIPSTGDLLLLRCSGGRKDPRKWRTPFISVVSRDDGQTWTHERVIMGDSQDDYGYPSLTFVGDTALICYHQRDGLHVLRIDVKWFYY